MTIVTQPYFFGHLDHLHKFRQWVKSAMFQPKVGGFHALYYGIQTKPPCVSWVKLVVRPVWVFHISEKLSSQITHKFCWSQMPHLTIQTSFSSSYSHRTPSLMTGATLTTFLHPAMHGTFPFGDAGTNWWKFSATKSAPSASWIQGIKSWRMRSPEPHHIHPSNPGHQLGFFNKKLSCINFRSWKFLEQNSLSNKNSSSPCCEETTLKAWPRLQARNLCHLHLQRTGS